MKKKIWVAVIFIVAVGLPIAWWLVSPLWRNVELNEALPTVQDNFETMDTATKEKFIAETETMKDKVMDGADTMPDNQPTIVAQAAMVARAHAVSGRALLVQIGDQNVLRFENLDTINGPDLRIYLSADLSADDIIDLGPIRATRGNVNYAIPAGTDVTKYKNALIWCRAFHVLFSYAQF